MPPSGWPAKRQISGGSPWSPSWRTPKARRAHRRPAAFHSPQPGQQRKIAETALRQAVAEALRGEDGGVELRTEVGSPGHVLVEAARSVQARMLVLATRKEHAPSRLLGAVSRYVLRNAPCPVLVVPEASKGL